MKIKTSAQCSLRLARFQAIGMWLLFSTVAAQNYFYDSNSRLRTYLLLTVLGLGNLLQQLLDDVKLALDEWIVIILGPKHF